MQGRLIAGARAHERASVRAKEAGARKSGKSVCMRWRERARGQERRGEKSRGSKCTSVPSSARPLRPRKRAELDSLGCLGCLEGWLTSVSGAGDCSSSPLISQRAKPVSRPATANTKTEANVKAGTCCSDFI